MDPSLFAHLVPLFLLLIHQDSSDSTSSEVGKGEEVKVRKGLASLVWLLSISGPSELVNWKFVLY